MTVNKIDVDNSVATLSLSRHEVTIIHKALQRMSNELTDEDEWFLLEINGVNDLLKDGNFTRFLSYHRELVLKDKK